MKKVTVLTIALLLVLLPAMLFAQAKPIVLRLAETHPKGYPTELGDEEFARLVKRDRMAALSSRSILVRSLAKRKQ